MTENDDNTPRLRPNHGDRHHDAQLLRDLRAINERTAHALGSLPPGGLPVQPRRKPRLPRPDVPPATPALSPSDEDTTMQWTSMAAVAALAASSALAACGAEGTTARVEPPAAVQAPPNEVVLPVVNAEPPAAETTAVEPASSREEETTEPERGPPIPAAQLRQRILALLGSLHALKDLERENVEKMLRMPLRRNPEMTEGYGYDGLTTEGWRFGVAVDKLNRLDEPPTIIVGMDYDFDYDNGRPPAYCTLEFEPLAKELVAMGYERTERMLRMKGNQWWGFRKENPDSRAVIGAMVYVYRISNDESGRYCIKSISFGGDPLDG